MKIQPYADMPKPPTHICFVAADRKNPKIGNPASPNDFFYYPFANVDG